MRQSQRQRRHKLILNIVARQQITSQGALIAALRAAGMEVSQTTISRDISVLNLEKRAVGGTFSYAPSGRAESAGKLALRRIFRHSVRSVEHSGELIIIKTHNGSAGAAAEAIDSSFHDERVLGTIAGDNTLFIAVTSPAACAQLADDFRKLLEETEDDLS